MRHFGIQASMHHLEYDEDRDVYWTILTVSDEASIAVPDVMITAENESAYATVLVIDPMISSETEDGTVSFATPEHLRTLKREHEEQKAEQKAKLEVVGRTPRKTSSRKPKSDVVD